MGREVGGGFGMGSMYTPVAVQRVRATTHGGTRASYCGGFSLWSTALDPRVSVVAAQWA